MKSSAAYADVRTKVEKDSGIVGVNPASGETDRQPVFKQKEPNYPVARRRTGSSTLRASARTRRSRFDQDEPVGREKGGLKSAPRYGSTTVRAVGSGFCR